MKKDRIMKLVRLTMQALVLVLTIIACGGSSSDPNPIVEPSSLYLTVSTPTLQFKNYGGTQALTVDANVNWTARADAEWCQVRIVSEKTIEVTVGENTSASQRSAVIIVQGNGQQAKVTVTQDGSDYTIEDPHNDVTDQPAFGPRHKSL